MTKFKHFETESGKIITTAEFDGYSIAERLLEGLMFQITIQPDGTLKASVKPSDEEYFSQFNTTKFLKEAEDYASDCDEFTDPVSGESCWLVVDGVDNRPKPMGIPIQVTNHPFQFPGIDVTKEFEEKDPIIGEFKPKRKFLNFVSAVNRNGDRIRFIRDIAFIKGEKLSGVLEGLIFKITICDEGTIKFEEVDTNQTDDAQRQRLLDDIDSMDVTGYAQKFVVGDLEFTDVNGDRCYLEVEHEKPIDRFASLLDMFDQEKKKVEEATLSDRGFSILDALFSSESDGESDDEIISTEKDAEVFFDAIENPAEPNENLKNAATSYMEEQFRKMNEDKINELKERISKKEEDISKYNRDISFAESKLKTTKEELGVLESRLDSMYPGDEPNGYAFYVSEEQKNETGLDESTRHIADKIADLMKLKKDVLFDYLTGGYYNIKIAPKDDFENENAIERDILEKVGSIDPSGKISMTGKGEFEYRGELTWHQLVGKMIKKGFEQVPEYDEFCNSNSYESHEEDDEVDNTQDMSDDITDKGSENSTEFKAKYLKTIDEPTHLVVIGTQDHTGGEDFSIQDDFCGFHAYINGKKLKRKYEYESDGFVCIIPLVEFKKWLVKNPWATEDGGGVSSFFLPNFSGTIEVGCKLEDGEYSTDFDIDREYIAHQLDEYPEEVFLNFPEGTTIIDMENHEIPLSVIRDMNIDKILN